MSDLWKKKWNALKVITLYMFISLRFSNKNEKKVAMHIRRVNGFAFNTRYQW